MWWTSYDLNIEWEYLNNDLLIHLMQTTDRLYNMKLYRNDDLSVNVRSIKMSLYKFHFRSLKLCVEPSYLRYSSFILYVNFCEQFFICTPLFFSGYRVYHVFQMQNWTKFHLVSQRLVALHYFFHSNTNFLKLQAVIYCPSWSYFCLIS